MIDTIIACVITAALAMTIIVPIVGAICDCSPSAARPSARPPESKP